MFKYYNYKLIESNRSYSTEKIKKLIGIHEQTIREWIKEGNLECVSKKPILIYGAVLKEFIKNKNESHKKTLNFNEFKCLKCKAISIPKDNQISIYHNKNGSIRATGICQNCNNEFSKLYKKNSINEFQNSFFIKPTESTLYNTSPINSKTNIENQKEVASNESKIEEQKEVLKTEEKISFNTHIKDLKTTSKSNIKQPSLFDFDYE
jgi:hypothetical protein